MTERTMTLTPKVQQRVMGMMALERGPLLMAEAAQLLGRCVRQVRRLRSAYRVRGPAALVHGNHGRPSPRRTAATTRQRVVTLARRTYPGVNHQHLTELLAQRQHVRPSRPPIHRILHPAGLPLPRPPLTLAEQLQGAPAPTQVGRVLRDLGIRWIPASSPQGKGRIERLFGTFQDRLLAELRLSNVRTREDANAFLGRFLRRYNARF